MRKKKNPWNDLLKAISFRLVIKAEYRPKAQYETVRVLIEEKPILNGIYLTYAQD